MLRYLVLFGLIFAPISISQVSASKTQAKPAGLKLYDYANSWKLNGTEVTFTTVGNQSFSVTLMQPRIRELGDINYIAHISEADKQKLEDPIQQEILTSIRPLKVMEEKNNIELYGTKLRISKHPGTRDNYLMMTVVPEIRFCDEVGNLELKSGEVQITFTLVQDDTEYEVGIQRSIYEELKKEIQAYPGLNNAGREVYIGNDLCVRHSLGDSIEGGNIYVYNNPVKRNGQLIANKCIHIYANKPLKYTGAQDSDSWAYVVSLKDV